MTEKTGVIGGLDLPEKAEHTRERDHSMRVSRRASECGNRITSVYTVLHSNYESILLSF